MTKKSKDFDRAIAVVCRAHDALLKVEKELEKAQSMAIDAIGAVEELKRKWAEH